jgi:ApaG protein
MSKYEFTVSVRTRYIEEQSDPAQGRFIFSYTITIVNSGTVSAQLVSRHWVIVDASGQRQEVAGLGVVGHQPLLKPGERFEYSSGTSLATANGSMHGEYFIVAEDGTRFEAPIPEFSLSLPRTLH